MAFVLWSRSLGMAGLSDRDERWFRRCCRHLRGCALALARCLRYHETMDNEHLTYRDYARYARQSAEEVARDCEAEAFRASGPGGQCVNTTDSAVRMTHLPTGITVTSRESRSQFRNRQLCLQKLRQEFVERAVPPRVRHATRPSRAARQRRLDHKHLRAQVKVQRRRIDE
ncbi:MAG: peptide chain release factor-like protein [Gordonibacter sp.]